MQVDEKKILQRWRKSKSYNTLLFPIDLTLKKATSHNLYGFTKTTTTTISSIFWDPTNQQPRQLYSNKMSDSSFYDK